MTRAEYEAELRGRTFQCRGARTKTAQDVAEVLIAHPREEFRQAGYEVAAAVLIVESPDVEAVLQLLFDHEKLLAARRLDELSRTFCGADVRPLILSEPLDGGWHEAPCPAGCGNVIEWCPPVVEG